MQCGNALDCVVGIALENYPNVKEGSVANAAFGETWPADGDHGKNLFANFFHCMKSWKKERVTSELLLDYRRIQDRDSDGSLVGCRRS